MSAASSSWKAVRTPVRCSIRMSSRLARRIAASPLSSARWFRNAIVNVLLMGVATVKTHLTHIYVKLNVTNRTALASQRMRRP
jgi:Bacterial regulatory proteins, luxR family